MKEQLITFETAKLAKEKGFDVPCMSFYYVEEFNTKVVKTTHQLNQSHDKKYLIPTQSLLQKWLREVHKIVVIALPYTTSINNIEPVYIWMIYKISASTKDNEPYTSYEEALEKGLQKALKLI